MGLQWDKPSIDWCRISSIHSMALLPDGRGGWDKVPGSAGRTLGQHGFSRHLALPKCSAMYPLLPLRFHVYIYISMYCISMYMYVYPFVPCSFHSDFSSIPMWFAVFPVYSVINSIFIPIESSCMPHWFSSYLKFIPQWFPSNFWAAVCNCRSQESPKKNRKEKHHKNNKAGCWFYLSATATLFAHLSLALLLHLLLKRKLESWQPWWRRFGSH